LPDLALVAELRRYCFLNFIHSKITLEPTANPTSKFALGRRSGKPTKRHLSLHRFCKALGYAPSQEISGDLQKSKVTGGSDLCRKALWQWIFTRIEPQRTRLNNDIGDRLGQIMDAEKASGRPPCDWCDRA
jgi:hypothetical protein